MATTPSRLAALLGDWRGSAAAHVSLAATLRSLVLDGRLPLESSLPAERRLAEELGVSRTTVTAAYERLRRDGYVASRRGSRSWVTLPGGHRAANDAVVPARGIDLRIAALPAPPMLDELVQAAVTELPRWLDHHGYDPLGLPPLREAIAARYTERGLPTRPGQVLVSNGAMHALDLVLRALPVRGKPVLVEIPSYPAALDALRAARARLDAVPVSSEGWDLAELQRLARDVRPALAYLIPDFQNPTGALMDANTRRTAVGALADAGTIVVVDETFAELQLDDVDATAPADATIALGSLAKSVWGGLRIGWVRAAESLVQRLATARATTDMASPVLEQLIAVQVLAGRETVVAERRRRLRAGRDRLAAALEPTGWRFTLPRGGAFLWVELPAPVATNLSVRAYERGVHVTPGPRFGAAGLLERFLRLPFTVPAEQLAVAVPVLAELAASSGTASVARGRDHHRAALGSRSAGVVV
jgi:DNA-binding transcriptional MocR family regulator